MRKTMRSARGRKRRPQRKRLAKTASFKPAVEERIKKESKVNTNTNKLLGQLLQ